MGLAVDGADLFVSTFAGDVFTLDRASGAVRRHWEKLGGFTNLFGLAVRGDRVFVAGGGVVQQVHRQTGAVEQRFCESGMPLGLCSDDNELFVVCYGARQVRVFDAAHPQRGPLRVFGTTGHFLTPKWVSGGWGGVVGHRR